MLKIAKQKAKLKQLKIKFLQGDCRTVQSGKFDAAITIFNAISHLTREDFKLTIQNINRNLNPGGLYIFDIFNLDSLKAGNNITKLTGDWMAATDGQEFREIQFSTISDDGILASYNTYVYQEDGHSSPTKVSKGDGNERPTKISKGYENTLQVYGSDELQEILKENRFVVLAQTDINGEVFSKETSERLLTVAKKV
jgi:SAM-dependent methyltransferase